MNAATSKGHTAMLGVASGLLAGLFLTFMMTGMSLMKGNDVWYGIKGASAPFFGERAMQPGFDLAPVWLGLAIHLAISVAWAIPFAWIFQNRGLAAGALRAPRDRLVTLAGGLAWGIPVWLGMYYVVLPAVGLEAMTREAPIARAVLYHVFFGVAVAASFLAVRRADAIAPVSERPRLRQPRLSNA